MISNYAAVVVKLGKVEKHPTADRLQCTNIFGNNVIVGLDAKEGDKGLFFAMESQIGLEFAQVNDLIRRKDADGKPAGGMFDVNRRVRAQTLRGQRSMGFWCPISYLDKLCDAKGIDRFNCSEGDAVESLAGYEISKKYVIPGIQREQPKSKLKGPKVKKKEDYILPEQFRFHFDTSHYGKNKHKVTPDSLISITWKTHGSSGIAANVLVKRDLSLVERIAKFFGAKVQETQYSHVAASRKVIKSVEGVESTQKHQHFYAVDLWGIAAEQFKGKLKKGEQLYYELVGHLPNSPSMIQKDYDYGCKEGEYKVQLYRVTMTSADGHVVDMPWSYVKHRAVELGIETVPEIWYGKAEYFMNANLYSEDKKFEDVIYEILSETYVYDQDCHLCKNKVPAEGIVIRIEYPDGSIENLKHKNFRFALRETALLDKGEADVESMESVEEQGEQKC